MHPLARASAVAFSVVLAGPVLACVGNVTIGEGADQTVTSVPNKAVGTSCINDHIIDTVAEGGYKSHQDFVKSVSDLVDEWRKRKIIDVHERNEIRQIAQRSDVGKTVTVRLIALNDFHGNLQSPGTFGVNTAIGTANRPAVGGAEYIGGHVARLKSQNPLSMVVGAGDFIGTSPLISALFSDEPAVEVMNRIGLEATSVGNHEFDKGSAELLRLQNGGCKAGDRSSCKGASVGTPVPFEGAKFNWLSANVFSISTNKTLLPPYVIKGFGRIKVAFIGMTLEATPTIVTPTGVAGLRFQDEADTVNALVRRLREQDVKAIVVLVHQGGFQSGAVFNTAGRQIGGFSDINGCDGNLAGSDFAEIVSRLDIPVTSASAFGRVLTAMDLVIDTQSHEVKAVRANNSLVDRTDATVKPDASVLNIVNAYNGLVSPIANQVIGSITRDLTNSNTFDKACNMPAGDLIADAQLAATASAGFGEAVIAFMNRGGVRNPGFIFSQSSGGEPAGDVTYGEAFTVQPFGNSLVTMSLTRQDIKNVLEQQFAGCRGQASTATRIMLASNGFRYAWDGSKPCDSRISNVTLTTNGITQTLVNAAGVVLDPLQTLRVTVNNFMSTGGDAFTTFLNGTNLLGGAQDIDALAAYLQANFKAPKPAYNPGTDPDDQGSPRINRVGGTVCPTGANANP